MILYQVLTRLFAEGKFSSFNDAAFAHIKSLGATHIWFTGIPRHASGTDFVKGDPGSPYAIEDYYDINPYLADQEADRIQEFRQLVRRTHDAGLKVIIDFIPNHVAVNNRNAIPVHNHCDYDWTDTRKIDYSNPDTLPELCRILSYWAGMGVDGFRLDMVDLVSNSDLASMIKATKANHPSIIFIGESYEKEKYRTLIYHSGFDYLYDKSGFYDIVRGIETGSRSAQDLTWHWQWLSEIQPRMLNFLENHDEQRCPSWAKGGSMAAMAYAALYNNAAVMLYFGQELGEKAEDGHEFRTSIFQWARQINPMGELSSEQETILSRYRELMQLSATPLYRKGANWDLAYCQRAEDGFNAGRHRAFLRYMGDHASLVVCNFEDSARELTIHTPAELHYQKEIKVSIEAKDYKVISIK